VPEGERTTAVVARASAPLIAIFNSRDEVIDAIRSALENDGFATVTARLAEIQNGTLDLVAFVAVHSPDVIVYDLPRPYENHWNFLRLMRETTSLKDRVWILTTTDKEALEAAVGASDVVEIILGQPYGANDVVDAVHVALGTGTPAKSQG
jgi:CheY-like chemotaxis protein